MATPRSTDAPGWRATALLYSGRPNPEWALPAEVGKELERLWAELPAATGAAPALPALGPRGFVVTGPDAERYEAAAGEVARDGERRADPDGRFAAAVLTSAPPGAVPGA